MLATDTGFIYLECLVFVLEFRALSCTRDFGTHRAIWGWVPRRFCASGPHDPHVALVQSLITYRGLNSAAPQVSAEHNILWQGEMERGFSKIMQAMEVYLQEGHGWEDLKASTKNYAP